MVSADLNPKPQDEQDPAANEVRFALVIARMIDTVRNSPEDMRHAVYDLARYKLQEQFTYADAKDIRRTEEALETAIRGVEAFARQHPTLPPSGQQPPAIPAPLSPPDGTAPGSLSGSMPLSLEVHPSPAKVRPHLEIVPERQMLPRTVSPFVKRNVGLLLLLGAILVGVQQRERLALWLKPMTETKVTMRADRSSEPPVPDSTPPEAAAASQATKPKPALPKDYGVYAINGDELTELPLLPGRAPDMRVAVSAAIKTPSTTVLPDAHPKFIVYRRDAINNISDHADVRIVARVAREFSPEAAGKKPDDSDSAWVIRNVAFAFRASPVPDNPEMYELHSEDPTLELTPGRYVLVVKNQAYGFSIDGAPTDARQCIERVVANNGTFYIDCKKP